MDHDEREQIRDILRSDGDDAAVAAVSKLLDGLRSGHQSTFTASETAALKEVAAYWLGMNFASQMLGHTARIVRWLGYVVALYLAWKSGILQQWLINRPPP